MEACSLLGLQKGSVLLLREILESDERKHALQALRDFQVTALTIDRAHRVLERKLLS